MFLNHIEMDGACQAAKRTGIVPAGAYYFSILLNPLLPRTGLTMNAVNGFALRSVSEAKLTSPEVLSRPGHTCMRRQGLARQRSELALSRPGHTCAI